MFGQHPAGDAHDVGGDPVCRAQGLPCSSIVEAPRAAAGTEPEEVRPHLFTSLDRSLAG